jgi:transposase
MIAARRERSFRCRNGPSLTPARRQTCLGEPRVPVMEEATICERVDCTPQTIATWKARYRADGIAGLRGRHRGSKARVLTPQVEARILSWTRKPPTDGMTHWSTRRLGDRLGVPHTIVQRPWKRAGLQPHRLERYLWSTDPNFEEKAAAAMRPFGISLEQGNTIAE